jgi:glutathione S-transferase
MRLYHTPSTRSTRTLWLLEEIGAPYDLTTMAPDERRGEEHRKRHPLGRVPVIEDDEGFVFESVAIALHLADLHPEAGLAPAPGTHERALVYQWLFFSVTEVEAPSSEAWRRRDAGDEEGLAAAKGRVQEAARAVDRALEGREYLVGDSFTVADFVVAASLSFARRLELLGDDLPNATAYVERVESRPARARALELAAAPAPA